MKLLWIEPIYYPQVKLTVKKECGLCIKAKMKTLNKYTKVYVCVYVYMYVSFQRIIVKFRHNTKCQEHTYKSDIKLKKF